MAEITDERAKGYITKGRESFKKLLEYASSDEGWKKSEEKSGVLVLTRKGDEGVSIIKGKGSIPFTCEEIKAFLWDKEETKKYDKDKEEAKTIEMFPLETEVGYTAYKGKMLASGRDFVYTVNVIRNDEGQLVITSGAVEHEGAPPIKKKVRAQTTVAGWLMTPSKTEPGSTDCIYVSHSNLKGSLPKMITNSVAKNQGFKIQIVRDAMLAKFGKK